MIWNRFVWVFIGCMLVAFLIALYAYSKGQLGGQETLLAFAGFIASLLLLNLRNRR